MDLDDIRIRISTVCPAGDTFIVSGYTVDGDAPVQLVLSRRILASHRDLDGAELVITRTRLDRR